MTGKRKALIWLVGILRRGGDYRGGARDPSPHPSFVIGWRGDAPGC